MLKKVLSKVKPSDICAETPQKEIARGSSLTSNRDSKLTAVQKHLIERTLPEVTITMRGIIPYYYMARACKYITRAVIGQYSGPDFPVMPTGIMTYVNARQVKREYRKCESTFDSNSSNDLKLGTVLGEYCPRSFLYGPRFARSVPERPRAIFSLYGLHARLIRSK